MVLSCHRMPAIYHGMTNVVRLGQSNQDDIFALSRREFCFRIRPARSQKQMSIIQRVTDEIWCALGRVRFLENLRQWLLPALLAADRQR